MATELTDTPTDASWRSGSALAPRPFPAAHTGTCSACGDDFDPGDLISRADTGWKHDTCPDDRPLGQVCTDCFMEKAESGACGC